MDPNKTLAIVLIATGIGDIALARGLAAKLPPATRTLLLVLGGGFIVLGGLIGFGAVRVV
ncbi:MAG: hypothetical protein SFW09_18600 [Hyphomicrobiaceae bacterium]|nr:hypothetical protein [Hyphomicrobiaceae bacterium]